METRPSRATLVVVFGGRSAEHDVSCVTAAHVTRAVDTARFDVVALGIDRSGIWHRATVSSDADRLAPDGPEASPDTLASLAAKNRASGADTIVVPLVHGPLGEDGTLQGLCEVLDLPYVGSGVLASAVAMDKGIAKSLFARAGLPQGRHAVLREDHATRAAVESVVKDLGLPVFVKPANMGSSVGVTKARTLDEVADAIDVALSYDEWVVIEEAIVGREIEVAVIGNRAPRASLPGEIVPAKEFYDYEDKYVTSEADLRVPADLDEGTTHGIREMAVRAYEALRCEGMARVDFFYEENGRGLLVNEVNTIPGFTPISMYPRMWQASGLGYSELITELVNLALERHGRRKRNTAH